MHFPYDVLWSICSILRRQGQHEIFLRLAQVCRSWRAVAIYHYWWKLVISTHPQSIDRIHGLISNFESVSKRYLLPPGPTCIKHVVFELHADPRTLVNHRTHMDDFYRLMQLLKHVTELSVSIPSTEDPEADRYDYDLLDVFVKLTVELMPNVQHVSVDRWFCPYYADDSFLRLFQSVQTWKLTSFSGSGFHIEHWYDMDDILQTQRQTLQSLALPFLFTCDELYVTDQIERDEEDDDVEGLYCMLDMIREAQLVRLKVLKVTFDIGLFLSGTYNSYDVRSLSTTFLRSLDRLVKAYPQLEHLAFLMTGEFEAFQLDIWEFLGVISTVTHLRTLEVGTEMIVCSGLPPSTLAFPLLEALTIDAYGQMFSQEMLEGLASYHYPRLLSLNLPRRRWTPKALRDILRHAPHLSRLSITIEACDFFRDPTCKDITHGSYLLELHLELPKKDCGCLGPEYQAKLLQVFPHASIRSLKNKEAVL